MKLLRLRNFVIAFLLIFAAFILQYSVFSRITVFSCSPNLMLIVVFSYGYSGGKVSGMLSGFFAGLLIDIFFCEVLGFNALLLLLIGFLGGIWNKYFYTDHIVLPTLMLLASDLIYNLIYYVVWFVFRSRFVFGFVLVHSIIPECILTVIAGIILYIPLNKLNKRLILNG